MFRPRNRSSLRSNSTTEMNEVIPFCTIHLNRDKQWQSKDGNLPQVHISIALLSTRVHHLLDIHGGVMSLNTFVNCYTKEFNELFDTSTKPVISLEHLITCVPGVGISTAPTIHQKLITWIENRVKNQLDDSIKSEPITNGHNNCSLISHFGKEVRELLKSQPNTIIPFIKFVPTYHSHFVRQLCVFHYGFPKLLNLLEELPHIVQVFGENDQRMITLTHREQSKRFAADMIKVLRAQYGRTIKLSQFSAAYESLFNKPFEVSDYGVCHIEDILRDVWEGTIVITPFGTTDKMIEMAKRERTADQIKRGLTFSREVIQMLSRSKEVIDFTITFSKFIPCYHRYYDRQCRVIDYGFNKLIELLEDLSPNVIEIHCNDEFGEKSIKLSYEHRLKAMVYRLDSVLKTFPTQLASVKAFEQRYERKFGAKIDYIDYYVIDLIDLVDIMSTNKFRFIHTKDNTRIKLVAIEGSQERSSHRGLKSRPFGVRKGYNSKNQMNG